MADKVKGWIGVDLDGTLAEYTTFKGSDHIGEPLLPLLEKVKVWLSEGLDIRIFTARVDDSPSNPYATIGEVAKARKAIDEWCLKHLGKTIPITNKKDYAMIALYDDRAIQMIPNTGISIQEYISKVI